MNLVEFKELPFVQPLRYEKRWTVVNKNKMPIDIMELNRSGKICGASFANQNEPLTDLDTLYQILPNATNATYALKQSLDDIVILDIEPKCPMDLKNRLLKLPYLYAETSMSGKGLHLVFSKPVTNYQTILLSKVALQEEHGYYEILLTHNITFTGNQIERPIDETPDDITEFYRLFDELAATASLTKVIEIDISDLPDITDIPNWEKIVQTLSQAVYKKKLEDFYSNYSKYEFGVTGFYYHKLKQLLSASLFRNHEYTAQEQMMLLYEVVKDKIPYREKHEESRDGLPYLLYNCKRIVTMEKITSKN